MPILALITIGERRRLPPIPVPLILLWPLVPLCLVFAWLLGLGKPEVGETLRAATLAFCRLRGLAVDVDFSGNERVRIRIM